MKTSSTQEGRIIPLLMECVGGVVGQGYLSYNLGKIVVSKKN
jgi:hypothetical protein